MKELNKLKQELMIMRTNNIKPNYSALARIHECDRRTVKKYDNGYEGKPTNRDKNLKRLDQEKTIGIIICKKDNKFIPKRHNTKFHNS